MEGAALVGLLVVLLVVVVVLVRGVAAPMDTKRVAGNHMKRVDAGWLLKTLFKACRFAFGNV
jgi:hypothetical protein